jgi:peptidoglycan-N-acetylglucosamine deacetylase
VRRLLLLGLIVVAAAVFAARTLGRPREVVPPPTAAPTAIAATPTARAAVQPGAAAPVATPKPTTAPTPRPSVIATPVRSVATHAATPTLVQPTPTTLPPSSPTTAPTALIETHPSTASVALTFDAGADRGYAEDILDALQEAHAVASFGITGNWARANPDLVRRMAADGHFVFNHTLDHRSFTGLSDGHGGLSAAARRAELDEADAIIAPLIGHTTRPFYRLPYGDDDARVAGDVASDGYTRKVGWTVDSLGWRGAASADILARCLKLAAPGAIYVFHVGRASQDAIALPQLIHALRDKGFGFRRIDEG